MEQKGHHCSLEFDILTWNVGGLTAENALETLEGLQGDRQLEKVAVVFLQEIILRPGMLHRESDHWSLVASKQATEWRGVGVAHKKQLGGHRNSHAFLAGLSTTLCLKGGTKLQCLTGHIPHHATIPETQHILAQWGEHVGPTKLIIGMDANEVFTQPFSPLSTSTRSFTGRGECILQWLGDNNITLPLQDISFPHTLPLQHGTQAPKTRLPRQQTQHYTLGGGGKLQTQGIHRP